MLIQTALAKASVSETIRHPDVADLLAETRPAAVSVYGPDSVIYAQGDAAGPLYLVEYGSVRLSRLTSDGRRQISAFVLAGEVFGFAAGGEHGFYAEAVASTGIRVLRPNASGQGTGKMLRLALNSLTRAQEHLLVLGRQNALERLGAFLLDMADRQESDETVHLPMSRNDIADYLGMSFETVSRVIGKLKDMRLIRLASSREVQLLDIEALRTLCE